MKALSFYQPWTDLIVTGKKTVELRSCAWNDHTRGILAGGFRGEFLVHASSKTTKEIRRSGAVTGAILGKAEIVGVRHYATEVEFLTDMPSHLVDHYFNDSQFACKKAAGFIVSNPVRFEKAVPYKGSSGFFDVPVLIVEATFSV